MYPDEWHKIFGDKTGESARRILPSLIAGFAVNSTVEVGCGNAHWSKVAIDVGVAEYRVVDGPWNDRDHLLVDSAKFVEADLSLPLNLPTRYDMAICLEVAEHVGRESAGILVKSLTEAADIIVFGAAIPFQGGYGHINEQWPSWWRALFEEQGFRAYDIVRPRHWADQAIHYWYRQNTFVYVNERNQDAVAVAKELDTPGSLLLFDAVHPEKFEEVASYRSLSLPRLLRRFPGWTVGRIRSKLTGAG